jgi:hypothetical protein
VNFFPSVSVAAAYFMSVSINFAAFSFTAIAKNSIAMSVTFQWLAQL